jgi:hypothetical protein
MHTSLLRRRYSQPVRKYKYRPSHGSHPHLMMAKAAEKTILEPKLAGVQIPDEVDLFAQWYEGIRNQGQEGACTGFATSNFDELLYGSKHGAKLGARLAPAYLYARTRMAEGTWPADSGAMMADEFAVLSSYGVCPEDDMPYDMDPAEPIPDICDAAAVPFRVSTPCTVDMSDPDKTKAVLASGMPIGIAIPVYESFESVGSDGILPIPDPSKEALLGGHGICTGGYKMINGALYKKVANQWGESWGDHGYCWMPMGYPIWEAWTSPGFV